MTVNYAKAEFICPQSCAYNAGMNKCMCREGFYDDCYPGTTICVIGQYK